MSVKTLTNFIFIEINIWYEFKEPQVSEFTEALDFRCLECDLERLDSGFFETEELLDVLGLFSREPPRAFINEFRLPFFTRDPSDI